MTHSRVGFTLVEVLVAIVMLGIGIVALTGSSAMVTRMIGRGKVETRAAHAATRRMETLRLAAHATAGRCTAAAFASGGPLLSEGLVESWEVPASGRLRRVRVTIGYLTVGGPRKAMLETDIAC